MTHGENAQIADEMLRDFSAFSEIFGGIEFYGSSTAFRDVFTICRALASTTKVEIQNFRKAYLFMDACHGKTSVSKAIEIEAKANGIQSVRFDGTSGVTLKHLKDLQNKPDILVVVDELPDSTPNRRALLERFNNLSGTGIILASAVYSTDASLEPSYRRLVLSHIDNRPTDKLAWLVGLIRENLRDRLANDLLTGVLDSMPVRDLQTFFRVPLGEHVQILPRLATEIADSIRLHCELQPDETFPQEELAVIFIRFFSPSAPQTNHGFRLWVEGDTDCQILRIVSKLVKTSLGSDLEEGLIILPIGENRDGGTSKILDVVLSKQAQRNKDLFLLDCDMPGKHAQDELKVLQQDSMLLEPKLSCSRASSEVEIEDFISLSCLDRFYEAHTELKPEMETVRYKAPAARRLVVDGTHKGMLTSWLEKHASLSDLENLFFLLCDIRTRFSLKNSRSSSEMKVWKTRLENEFDQAKHIGSQPRRWSPVTTETT